MISNINNNINIFNTQSSKIDSKTNLDSKIKNLQEELTEYNDKKHTNLKFIDILEDITSNLSTQEKIDINKNGLNLIKKVEDKIKELKGEKIYEDKSINKLLDLQKDIFTLKERIFSEKNEDIKEKLKIDLIILEGQLFSFFQK